MQKYAFNEYKMDIGDRFHVPKFCKLIFYVFCLISIPFPHPDVFTKLVKSISMTDTFIIVNHHCLQMHTTIILCSSFPADNLILQITEKFISIFALQKAAAPKVISSAAVFILGGDDGSEWTRYLSLLSPPLASKET